MPFRVIGLFLEDLAQEQYIQALTKKLMDERGITVELRPYVSRGGRPAVISELRAFFRVQGILTDAPDYIVVGND